MARLLETRFDRRYFAPPAVSFWRWHLSGDVLEWNDGRTIAFRQELNIILPRLRYIGLPPFGAIVLLLAACRESWGAAREVLGQYLEEIHGTVHYPLLAEVVDLLNGVNADRHLVAKGSLAKAELAAIVFEATLSRADAKRTQQRIGDFLGETVSFVPRDVSDGTPLSFFHDDLATLREGLSVFDPATFEQRIKTSLEHTIAPASIELPPPWVRSKHLFNKFHDDEELGGIVRLAKRLLAAVTLPRVARDPEELPIDGVSDITNRGTLDRLLLSELAYDDLTLAVRVGMNEAMYLRREPPLQTPPWRYQILIDAGLRMWGVPRVFAAAVGLALTAQATDRRVLEVAVSDADRFLSIDLTVPEGLQKLLAHLDHRVHPSVALANFVQTDSEMNSGRDKSLAQRHHSSDVILITAPDVIADDDFQQAIRSLALSRLYIATVTRSGDFEWLFRGTHGVKSLRRATFDLESILKAERNLKTLSVVEETWKHDLPAIERVSEYPLLHHVNVTPQRSWHVMGVGVLTFGVIVYRTTMAEQGAMQYGQGIGGDVLWCSSTIDEMRITAVLRKRHAYAWQHDVPTGKTEIRRLHTSARPVAAFGNRGTLFVEDAQRGLHAFDARTGALLDWIKLPDGTYRAGRYLYEFNSRGDDRPSNRVWQGTISFDGHKIAIEPLNSNGLLVFDSFGIEGPVTLSHSGRFDFQDGRRAVVVRDFPADVAAIWPSRDGRRVLVSSRSNNRSTWDNILSIDVRTGMVTKCDTFFDTEPELLLYASTQLDRGLRFVRVNGIGIESEGAIALSGRGNRSIRIRYDAKRERLEGLSFASSENVEIGVKSKAVFLGKVRRDGYALDAFQWPDGRCAWYDRRGLIHLRHFNRKLPELTIVLGLGEVSGWVSDGHWFGSSYYVGSHATISHVEVFTRYFQPFISPHA